jgi:CheY-like chemotaxis protein
LQVSAAACLHDLLVSQPAPAAPVLQQSEQPPLPALTVVDKLGKLEHLHGALFGALVDLHLAHGRSGLDEIRALRNAGFNGRIVAMSADDDAHSEQSAHAAGADGFIAKPFQFTQLFEVLDGNVA